MAEAVELLSRMNETPDRATPLLAICIPTHNRRIVLEECLESVLPQADALGVGVCVSDNCSSDGTWQALESLKLQYPWMQIVRHTRDIGYRDNLTAAVLSSRAQYVWPIGDKMVLLPGALEYAMSMLVHLDPDAVIVNSLYGVASTAEKTYSAAPPCLVEMGGFATLLGASILPRQAWIDVLHVQPLSRDFPQVVALFSHLAALPAPRVLFSGRVFTQVGKRAMSSRTQSYWADRGLETWGYNWPNAIMGLPALYSADDKVRTIRSHSLCLADLVKLRAEGRLTLESLGTDRAPLRMSVSVAGWLVKSVCVIPVWVLRPILGVHPRQIWKTFLSRRRLQRQR